MAEVLDHVDVLENGERLLAPLREDDRRLLGPGRARRQQPRRDDDHALHRGAPAGSAPPATASMARSIGTCATPLARSTQPNPFSFASCSARHRCRRLSTANGTWSTMPISSISTRGGRWVRPVASSTFLVSLRKMIAAHTVEAAKIASD